MHLPCVTFQTLVAKKYEPYSSELGIIEGTEESRRAWHARHNPNHRERGRNCSLDAVSWK
jgi:hypothetical protein